MNLESKINSIYCVSQEASSTITNLRTYPYIANNLEIYRLYMLLWNLQVSSLEAFKTVKLNRRENIYLTEIFSMASDIEKTYELFRLTAGLSSDHAMNTKLKFQIENLVLMLLKLSQLKLKLLTIISLLQDKLYDDIWLVLK
jgi:hypothetical protein